MDIPSKAGTRVFSASESLNWRALYHQLLPKIFYYFWYRTGDEQIAEDLTASTFERAWCGRSRFRKRRGKFTNWVFGIARNVALEHYRHKDEEHSLDEADQLEDGKGPDELLEAKEEKKNLEAMLSLLSSRDRELLSLKYGFEITNREIAQLTDLSESNVGTILHRAVGKMRSNWEK